MLADRPLHPQLSTSTSARISRGQSRRPLLRSSSTTAQCHRHPRHNSSTIGLCRQHHQGRTSPGPSLPHRHLNTAHTTEAPHRLPTSERYLLHRLSRSGLSLGQCRQLPRSDSSREVCLQHLRFNTVRTIVVRRHPRISNRSRAEAPRLRRRSFRISTTTTPKKTKVPLHHRHHTVSRTIPIEQSRQHRPHKTALPPLNRRLRILKSSLLHRSLMP